MDGSKEISVCLDVNPLFVTEGRLHLANLKNYAFNKNTNEATSYRQVTAMVNNPNLDKPLCGEPQVVNLDFKCDQETLEW